MDKNNGLLPFAYSFHSSNERSSLSTVPREKHVIDENASSIYHTRKSSMPSPRVELSRPHGPVLHVVPSIKRKMGESFSEKDDIKRRDHEAAITVQSTQLSQSSENFFAMRPGEHTVNGGSGSSTDATEPDVQKTDLASYHGSQKCNLPSSPPVIPQQSEFDFSATDFAVPDSPVRDFAFPETSPVKRASRSLRQSSDADFGIDQFNRYRVSSYTQCPSTDADGEEEYPNDTTQFNRARDIILQSFEDVSPSISLEGMHLTEIPDEIRDLNNLVIFDSERPTQVSRQLYLTNNKIKVLNPLLFTFTKLNVLSLRQNQIQVLPKLIAQLEGLTDLNISINKLKYLPPEILDLPNLMTFRAGPNPFLPVSSKATEISHEDPRSGRGLKWVSPVQILQRERILPSLKALALDVIAKYDVTYRETKTWKSGTPKIYHSLIAMAISKGKFRESCDQCDMCPVEPYAEVVEWWDILQNIDIPIKRVFCSGMCVAKYEANNCQFSRK